MGRKFGTTIQTLRNGKLCFMRCVCSYIKSFQMENWFSYGYFRTGEYKLEQNKMYSFLPGTKFQQQNRRKSSLEPPEPRKRSLSFSAIVKATSRGTARDRRGRRKPVFVRAANQIRLRWKSQMESNYNQYELPKSRRWVGTVLLVLVSDNRWCILRILKTGVMLIRRQFLI